MSASKLSDAQLVLLSSTAQHPQGGNQARPQGGGGQESGSQAPARKAHRGSALGWYTAGVAAR